MYTYTRRMHYYETDMMGVIHHANYIRLMEEARIDFLESIGYSYKRLEDEGIISPVTQVACKYIASTTFNDEVTVSLRVASFNGVLLTIAYEMHKADGTLCFTATSEHCFLNRQGRFVRLKRDYPAFFELLNQLAQEQAP